MARIDTVEKVNDERMKHITGFMVDIKDTLGRHDDKFEDMNKAFWAVAGSLIVMALSIIAFLAIRAIPGLH